MKKKKKKNEYLYNDCTDMKIHGDIWGKICVNQGIMVKFHF